MTGLTKESIRIVKGGKWMKYLPKDENEVKKWLKEFSLFYRSNQMEYYKYLKIEQHAYADYPCRELSEKIILKSFQNIVNIINNYKKDKNDSYIIYTEDLDFIDGQRKDLELILQFKMDGSAKIISAWREKSKPHGQCCAHKIGIKNKVPQCKFKKEIRKI